jgi:hypothetical protein
MYLCPQLLALGPMLRRFKNIYRRMWQNYAKGMPAAEAALAAYGDGPDDDIPLTPPSTERIARRAVCLAGVCFRSFLESWEAEERRESHLALLKWLSQAGLDEEFEPNEAEAVHTPPSMLPEQTAVNGSWRAEGLGVLLHALGRFDVPSHDEMVDPKQVCQRAGLWKTRAQLDAMIRSASLRTPDIADELAARTIAVHWRLRQFRHIEPKQIDFAAVAASVDWAKFDLANVELIDGDLGIKGAPIVRAAPDEVQLCTSIAQERHQAANWLCGWDPVYSDVDTST